MLTIKIIIVFIGPIVMTEQCDILYNLDHYVTREKRLTNHVIWLSKTKDFMECAQSCVRRNECQSINFDTKLKICEINRNKMGNAVSHEKAPSYVYSEFSTWPPQIDPDCYKRPCQDNQVCIPGRIQKTESESSCSHICLDLGVTSQRVTGSVTQSGTNTESTSALNTGPTRGTTTEPTSRTYSATQSGTNTASPGGTQPATQSGTNTAPPGGTQPATQSGTNTAPPGGTQPTKQSGTNTPPPGDTQPATQSGTINVSPGGTQPATQSGTNTAPSGGTQPATQSGTNTAPPGGTQPTTQSGTITVSPGGIQPATQSGTNTAPPGGTQPATQSGTNTAPPGGTQPATQSGTNTASPGGTQTSTQSGTITASPGGTQPATQSGTNTAPPGGTQPATQSGTNTAPPGGTQPATQSGANTAPPGVTQPATQSGTNTAPPGGTQPATQSGTNTASPGGTQTTTQSGTIILSPGGTQPATQSGTNTAPPGGTQPATQSGTDTATQSGTDIVTTTQVLKDARLVDRSSINSGRLVLYDKGDKIWRSVHLDTDEWNWKSTEVVCRQLGFSYGGSYHEQGKPFPPGDQGSFVFMGLVCDGSEDSIYDCQKDSFYKSANNSDDIGVTCFLENVNWQGNNIQELNLQLITSDGRLNPLPSNPSIAKIEYDGTWTRVCGELREKAADVFCKTMFGSDWGGDGNSDDGESLQMWTKNIACFHDDTPHPFFCMNEGWELQLCTQYAILSCHYINTP